MTKHAANRNPAPIPPHPGPMNGWHVRAWRDSLGWSQSEAAQALGVTVRTVRRWEMDEGAPGVCARYAIRLLAGDEFLPY